MSVAGTTDLPLEVFSGMVSEIAPSDLPAGASPNCRDVQFPLGAWRTRPGMGARVFPGTPLGANATVNYQKTFIDQQLNKRYLLLDSRGSLNQEFPFGTLNPGINTIPIPENSYGKSATAYGKEYLAYSDGQFGISDPCDWNGLFYDRVSQVGPGSGPTSITDISFTINSVSRTSGLITIILEVAYADAQMSVGELINITGVNADPTFNGQFPIVSVTDSGGGTTTLTAWGNPGIWNVNSMTRTANVVTAVLQQTPAFTGTPVIVIGNAGDSSFNGEFAVVSIAGNVVTWNQVAANSSTLTALLYTSAASNTIPIVHAINNFELPGSGGPGFVFELPPGLNLTGIIVGSTVTLSSNSVTDYNTTVAIEYGPITSTDGNIDFQAAALAAGSGTGYGGTLVAALPDSSPAASGIAGPAGNITIGQHQCSVFFVTRSFYYTKPSPPVTWTAAGGFKAQVAGIPTGPANVLQRILVFTEADSDTFYFTTNASNELANGNMVINDNTTVSGIFDFSDTILASGSNAQYLFALLELEASAGVVAYATRLFWWGGRNRIPNFNNMSFDGGVYSGTGANALPCGWQKGTNFIYPITGAGAGVTVLPSGYWAFQVQSPGDNYVGVTNMIQQGAYEDYLGNQILLPNTAYSARIKFQSSVAMSPGTVIIEFYSPSMGSLAMATMLTTAIPIDGTIFTEYILAFNANTPAVIPSDTLLRFYVNWTAASVLETVALAKNLEIFPTLTPYLTSTLRASYAGQPESYDEETGVLQPYFQDGGVIRNAFVLREKLYLCKDGTWFVTEDDGANEPSAWKITPVSLAVGCCGFMAADLGEDWGIVANRQGVYVFWGSEPIKINQEIMSDSSNSGKPVWESVNWDYGYTIWVLVDRVQKRALVGAPTNGATSPNMVFYFDFVGCDTVNGTIGQAIADHWTVKYSQYTGKILAIGNSGKWAPWNLSSNSAALIERADGTTHTFIGAGAAAPALGSGPYNTANVYDLLDSNLDDDGAGIPWSYSTYLTPSHMEEAALQIRSHRKLYSYLSGYVKGAGLMAISMQPMGNITPIQNEPLQLVDPDISAAISSIARINRFATVTCPAGHGLTNGIDTQAVIQNAGDASFNGTFPIMQILNSTQFMIFQYLLPDLTVGAVGTVNRLSREFEFTTNVLGERVSYTFSNSGNAAGSWVQCEKIVFSIIPDPWSPVRGQVY